MAQTGLSLNQFRPNRFKTAQAWVSLNGSSLNGLAWILLNQLSRAKLLPIPICDPSQHCHIQNRATSHHSENCQTVRFYNDIRSNQVLTIHLDGWNDSPKLSLHLCVLRFPFIKYLFSEVDWISVPFGVYLVDHPPNPDRPCISRYYNQPVVIQLF